MGDRTNVVISYKSTAEAKQLRDVLNGAVVLYSHWGGYSAGPSLAAAMRAAQPRWCDHGYAARIIVSRFVGNDWQRETGYGLYAGKICDNEHAVFVVDFEQKLIRLFGNPGVYLNPDQALDAEPTGEWSFEAFASLGEDAARAAHLGESAGD